MRILIVEDNSEMRKTIRRFIASSDDKVKECEDGIDALETYKTFQPDWVLMDYEMKYKDGIKATSEIINADPNAKIILISQYNDQEIIDSAIRSGALKFIPKTTVWELKYFIENYGK
jgi:CheY-like chemotaxis protein